MKRAYSLTCAVILLLATGCGGGEPAENDLASDTGTPDTGVSDTSDEETGTSDTLSGECRVADDCAPPDSPDRTRVACVDLECRYTCRDGYQDANDDGTCRPTCESADLDCGTATCAIDEQGEPACSCPAGLSFDADAETCRLDQFFDNPSFQDDAGWSLQGGASLDVGGDGEARFSPQAIGEGARLSQTRTLGSYREVGPLLVTIDYRLEECEEGGCRSQGPQIFAGGRAHGPDRLPYDSFIRYPADLQARFCLGPAAYGGERTFEIVPTVMPGLGEFERGDVPPMSITDVSVRRAPASVCGSVGEITNGSFELGEEGSLGWRLADERPDPDFSLAGTTTRDGDRQLELGGGPCSRANAETSLTVPEAPVALEFEVDRSPEARLEVELGRFDLRRLSEGQSTETIRVCMPRWARGTSTSLRFRYNAFLEGACANQQESIYIDDVRMVRSQSCGSLGDIPGGDFESTEGRALWLRSGEGNGFGHSFVTESGGDEANTAAELTVERDCDQSRMQTVVQLPDDLADSPTNALQMRYRWQQRTDASARFDFAHRDFTTDFGPNSEWTERTVCMPEAAGGYRGQLSVELEAPLDDCDDLLTAPQRLRTDDFMFTSDDQCDQE